MEEFERILSEPRTRSENVSHIVVVMIEEIHKKLRLIIAILRVTATPEEDRKLRDSIITLAHQCQKVISELNVMKDLEDFTEK